MVDLSIFNSLVPSQGMSEEAQRALLANALRMQQSASDTSPIRSPWQGAARLADGLFAGIANYRAAAADKANREAMSSALQGLFSGGQASAMPAPAAAIPGANALNPALASGSPIQGGMSDIALNSGDMPRADLTQPGPGPGGRISMTDPALSALPIGGDDSPVKSADALGVNKPSGDYYSTTADIENPSGNPQATSPTGATGQYQFTSPTWKQYGGGGNIHGDQQAAMTRLSQANNDQLTQRLGRPPTAGELYLAHQQGAAGAAKLINNPDSTPQQLGLGHAVAVQNGGKPFVNVPASQYVEHWTSQFDGVQNPFSGPTQLAGDVPSLGAVPMGSSPSSGGGNVTPGGPGGGATPQPPPQGLLPVPSSGPYGAVASARGDAQSGAPLPGYRNIGAVADMGAIPDINMVPGFGGDARPSPSYVSGMNGPNANIAGMEPRGLGATMPPQLALARALSNFSGNSPDNRIQLAGDIPTIGAVTPPATGGGQLTPEEVQGQQARQEALAAGAARTIGLPQRSAPSTAASAPVAPSGPAIVVPGYEKTGAVTRAQAEAAPEDSTTMPSTDEWDAAAARGGKPSGAPPATTQVAPTAPAAAAPAPSAQQAPGPAPAAQQGQGALGLAPEGSHYAQLPGPPLLLPGPGSGGSGGFGFGGLGDMLSHIFGFGGAPPFNGAAGGAAIPPGASQPQAGKQISGQLADQAGAGGQASTATQAAPQMYNGIPASQLKGAAQIMMNPAAPAEYRALAKEILQRAIVPAATRPATAQEVPPGHDPNNYQVTNGKLELIPSEKEDTRRATAADMPEGSDPDAYKGYQVTAGKLEPIAPARPVNTDIVKLSDGRWQTVDKATGNPIGSPIGEPMDKEATLSDEAASLIAERGLKGDLSGFTGLGYGKIGAANRTKAMNLLAAKADEQGLDAGAIIKNIVGLGGEKAGARTMGVLGARINTFAEEAKQTGTMALTASEAMPREAWVPIEKIIQMGEGAMNNPKLSELQAANNAFANTYSKAVNPSGVPTDEGRRAAFSLLNVAKNPEAYAATVRQLQREMEVVQNAIGQSRATQLYGGQATPSTPPPMPGPGPSGAQHGANPSATDPLAAARDAISRGAPRAAVIQRLQQNGIDPGGL